MADARGQTSQGTWRLLDYFFGRNALISIASMMLLLISGYATWSGMQDFIVGVSSSPAAQGKGLPGGFNVSHDWLVVAITIALTFLMWIALRETFRVRARWTDRLVTAPLYLFLALWSIGFGYGFWWSLISGEEATRTGLSALQEDARDASSSIAARLDAVRGQLDSVVAWSESQMSREETSGGSCGVASGAGKGPLYNARRSVRDGVAQIRDTVNKSWLGPVQKDLEELRGLATGVEGASTEERQKRFEAMASSIRGKARNIASRSNELGASTAADMRALAKSVSIAPGQPGFACNDPTLAQRLNQAADQASVPAKLQLRQVAFNEGPAGVANAVKNLWKNVGAYMGSLFRWVFSGGREPLQWTSEGEPITGRDMIALLATIGIDLGLLALALLDRLQAPAVRHDGLAANLARLHVPPGPVVRQLSGVFETALARVPDVDLEWVGRHFVHHNGASYFVIPNLYQAGQLPKKKRTEGTSDPPDKEGDEATRLRRDREMMRALAMNQLAGVFDDLNLVRTMSRRELEQLGLEEERHSITDLNRLRDESRTWYQDPSSRPPPRWQFWRRARTPVSVSTDGLIRNHGLFSKAQRALDIADWSREAQSDVEIFRLVDKEGLTPILMLLAEAQRRGGRGDPPSEEGGGEAERPPAARRPPAALEHKAQDRTT